MRNSTLCNAAEGAFPARVPAVRKEALSALVTKIFSLGTKKALSAVYSFKSSTDMQTVQDIKYRIVMFCRIVKIFDIPVYYNKIFI